MSYKNCAINYTSLCKKSGGKTSLAASIEKNNHQLHLATKNKIS
jgi:hypothetical protein